MGELMKVGKLSNLIIVISLVFNVITISYLYILLDDNDPDEKPIDEEIIPKPEPEPNQFLMPRIMEINESWDIDIGDFIYGTYNLSANIIKEIGNLSIEFIKYPLPSGGNNTHIKISNFVNNETLASFSSIKIGKEFGIRGLKMIIIDEIKENITVEFLPYDETDYLGKGVFYPKNYNRTFSLEEKGYFFWKDFTFKNDSALIEVHSQSELYSIWISDSTLFEIGIAEIEIEVYKEYFAVVIE
jgi:hypothetical protein